MSKTTVALFITLLLFIGILLFVVFGVKQDHILTTLTQQISKPSIPPDDTSLSFSTDEQAIQRGQTITTTVLVHNPDPQTDLVQLELSYDPMVFTVENITQGSFFTNPAIVLQKIDPVTGRISYALHCPSSGTNTSTDCINSSSSTVAVITLSVNSYAINNTTTLSFLPKTVIRVKNGRDILQSTNKLQLTIGKQLYPIASKSAIASPGANLMQITPAH